MKVNLSIQSLARFRSKLLHALVEGGRLFLVPGGRLEVSARPARSAPRGRPRALAHLNPELRHTSAREKEQ